MRLCLGMNMCTAKREEVGNYKRKDTVASDRLMSRVTDKDEIA